ncbi:Hypothetical protein NocV09_01600410 [Nannochloropsis oceanica]
MDNAGHDERCAVIQAVSHRNELPQLLNFLRATCIDALLQESWVSRETVLTAATADRRQRAVTLKDEYVEPVVSSTESPGMHLRLRGSVQLRQQEEEEGKDEEEEMERPEDEDDVWKSRGRRKGGGKGGRKGGRKGMARRVVVYEERDIRSSAEALIRRRVTTPVHGEEIEEEDNAEVEEDVARNGTNRREKGVEAFMQFQGCVPRSSALLKRGIRCQFTRDVRLAVFTVVVGQQQQQQQQQVMIGGEGYPLGIGSGPTEEEGGREGEGDTRDLLLVELEAPVGAHKGVLGAIEAVKNAAAVLQDFIVVRPRKSG